MPATRRSTLAVPIVLAACAGASLAAPLLRASAHRHPAPRVRTGVAQNVTGSSATVLGRVRGRGAVYWVQYGPSRHYGHRTRGRRARKRAVDVAVSVRGLRTATTYHYRLVARTRAGTRYGADRTLRTWPPQPTVSSSAARTITATSAALSGAVNARGQRITFAFEYGTTRRYGSSTPVRRGSGRSSRRVTASIGHLRPSTTYHFRLVATNCHGCTRGTAYSRDRVLTTHTQAVSASLTPAQRAVATYAAMQRFFYAGNVYAGDTTGLYAPTYPAGGERYAHLWPFSRALAGTIALAGMPGGGAYVADAADRVAAVEHYWDGTSSGPGYDSSPGAGDKYYDDQAWVGLALAAHYALTGAAPSLASAEGAFQFVYPGGWDANGDFDPGGVYWVQQGIGVGATNHERATAANAPSAELGFRLAELDPGAAAGYASEATTIYQWVNHYLYNVPANATDPTAPNPNYDASQPALVWGPVRGGRVVKSRWTYNQGEMVAANALAYRRSSDPRYLADAEAIARAALSTYTEADYRSQPAAFDAIYFRGLLQLYPLTADALLRSDMIKALEGFADDVWANYRDADGLFRLPSSAGARPQLLDQGAMLEIYAALAWSPSDYPKLP